MSDKYSNSLQVNSLMATSVQADRLDCNGNLLLTSNGSALIWMPAANTLGFATGGVNRANISSSAISLSVPLDKQAAQPCLIYNYNQQPTSTGVALLLSTTSGTSLRNVGSFTANAGANAWIVPSAGTYLVNGSVEFGADGANSRALSISANGAIVKSVRTPASANGAVTGISTSVIFQAIANSAVGIQVLQDSGNSINATGQVSVFRIA